jgi:hypothetical protein
VKRGRKARDPDRRRSVPLSNDVPVSTPAESEPHKPHEDDEGGVLANLPRARPQRATPRRAAARERANATRTGEGGSAGAGKRAAQSGDGEQAAAADAKQAAARSGKRTGATKPRSRAAASRAKPRAGADARAKASPRRSRREHEEPVPRQGFASDDDRATGPVQPPGGPELLATAAEIVSELAKAGVGAGERFVRDIVSRLPGS